METTGEDERQSAFRSSSVFSHFRDFAIGYRRSLRLGVIIGWRQMPDAGQNLTQRREDATETPVAKAYVFAASPHLRVANFATDGNPRLV